MHFFILNELFIQQLNLHLYKITKSPPSCHFLCGGILSHNMNKQVYTV
jgi:hypothetical protein